MNRKLTPRAIAGQTFTRRKARNAQKVAPLVLQIHGTAHGNRLVAELLYVSPFPTTARGNTLDERLSLLERPRVVMLASSGAVGTHVVVARGVGYGALA